MNGTAILCAGGLVVALAYGGKPAEAAQVTIPPGASFTVPAGASLGLACADLVVQGTLTLGAVTAGMAGDVSIAAGGTIAAGASTLTLGGSWNNAGTFTRGTSTVQISDGCKTTPVQFTGNTTFANLTLAGNGGRTFVLPAGNAVSVEGALVLAGTAGMPIRIDSANPSMPTTIGLGPSATVAASNVTYGTNVTVGLPPDADLDGDGIPNEVESAESRNPYVKDNDVFGNARLFAMQQYRDFLGREGDPTGIQAWTGQVSGGLQTRAQVIESFFDSAEFQNGLPQITRIYFAFFNRIPDYPGLLFHAGRYRAGVPLNTIAQDFAGSQEFLLTYGSLSNGQYVDLVYQNVLGRPADPAGRANALAQLDGGALTRGELMVAFSESQEHLNLSASEVFVTAVYVGMLRRSPDPGGLENWINAFGTGMPRVQMLEAFLNSAEYHNRFLP